MLVKQRITIEGGIQIVIELRGKRDVAIHYVKSTACEAKLVKTKHGQRGWEAKLCLTVFYKV